MNLAWRMGGCEEKEVGTKQGEGSKREREEEYGMGKLRGKDMLMRKLGGARIKAERQILENGKVNVRKVGETKGMRIR